ncbi:11635_t:CDS:2, partial [Acaulospora colombiana]
AAKKALSYELRFDDDQNQTRLVAADESTHANRKPRDTTLLQTTHLLQVFLTKPSDAFGDAKKIKLQVKAAPSSVGPGNIPYNDFFSSGLSKLIRALPENIHSHDPLNVCWLFLLDWSGAGTTKEGGGYNWGEEEEGGVVKGTMEDFE